ncbi:hypothetical protein [Bacillus sp. Marseille-P3661]|uniref:hypothetical protein n=1 Tax=Bacillus sp. Marseille-P3661 TaxID=1936234 RepID=UPI000C834B6C|nr:hypothetical protein [Bacillus sp. Marseille-P3661]
MGWQDFINSNPVGKVFSKVATSTLDSVDKVVQNEFDKVERKIDSFDKKGQALGGAIDNIGNTAKRIKNYGMDRNHLDEIYENKKIIDENLPTFMKKSKTYKKVSKVVETSKKITDTVDKVNELKK